MTDRTTRRRLERAGYTALTVGGETGYVPFAFAERAWQQVLSHREEVARIVAAPAQLRGRPRKQPK